MTNDRIQELNARIKTFAVMLKFGHDLFNAPGFDDAAVMAVNNTHILLNYKSASLAEVSGGKGRIIAQYAQPSTNPHSRLAVLQSELCAKLELNGKPQEFSGEALPAELSGSVYYALPLLPPASLSQQDFRFIWLLEYENEVPAYVRTSAGLLSTTIAEALYFHRLNRNAGWRFERHFSIRKMVWLLLLLLVCGSMFLKVPESTNAEFILKAPEISSAYAWFDGPIAKCRKQDGSIVKKGDVIAEYDTSALQYRLSAAQNAVKEIEAELELERRSSFTERERLGKLKLLETRLETARITVEEAQWYLAHSKLTAPADGILALADGRAEMLTGKAVRTGDRIFDIYGGSGMTAEIPVNERDSSILLKNPSATLFLYTAPEQAIPVRILEIAQYPELTEQRTYCYTVRAELPAQMTHLRYGMRGIAKLTGERVSLGYHLFKNAVLYFRGL